MDLSPFVYRGTDASPIVYKVRRALAYAQTHIALQPYFEHGIFEPLDAPSFMPGGSSYATVQSWRRNANPTTTLALRADVKSDWIP